MSLYDTRFLFKNDNPFGSNSLKSGKLLTHINRHPEDFIEIDYLTESRYMMLAPPDVTTLFGHPIEGNIMKNPIANKIKTFIRNIQGISQELKEWCADVLIDSIPKLDEIKSQLPPEPYHVESLPVYQPSKPSSSYSNYDVMSGKMMSVDDLRVLSANLAQSHGSQSNDETVSFLVNEKKRVLITEIMNFSKIKGFSIFERDDFDSMSLEQLENQREQCEQMLNKLKIDNALSGGFNLIALGYNAICPTGIPIGGERYIEFGDMGKDIRENLLISNTASGFAFSRMLSKYHIKISDTVSVLLCLGETVLKNVKVVKKSPSSKEDKHAPDEKVEEEEISEEGELESVSDSD
jgi:hypothetical protein